MNIWLDHCWTVLDSWIISSLGFQLESFVSLPCSEGLEWLVSLEISVLLVGNLGGWKLGKMEDSLGSSHLEGEWLVAETYPGGGLAYGTDTGSGMTLGEVTAMIGMITARPEESGSDYATGHESTVGSPLDLAERRRFYSAFNTVCLLCLSCCLLLVYGLLLLFFDEENVLFAERQPIQDSPSQR